MMLTSIFKSSAVGLAGMVAIATSAMAEYRLTILHVNDTHARFEP